MADNDPLAAAWREQSVWSKTAGELKAEISRWRTVVLAALIIGAIFETLALQFEGGSGAQRTLALVGAGALAVVPVVRATRVNRDGIINWTRARSVSEAIKQEVYAFVTGVLEYRDPATKAERLRSNVDRLLNEASDLAVFSARVDPVDREPPPPMAAIDYLEARVRQQYEHYYRPKARQLAQRLRRLRSGELALAIAAALIGAVAAVSGSVAWGGWVAVATTISGALVAHRAASRYEHLVISYTATARRLESLYQEWSTRLSDGTITPAEEDDLVTKCEDAISVENQAWMTSWARSRLD